VKIQTLSIVCGTAACNARCSFCVSKMTPANGVELKPQEINWRNFDVAAKLARDGGCSTAMITSKGEPTLFPDDVTSFVDRSRRNGFPLIELQTNGIPIWTHREDWQEHLSNWYWGGLTTVAISVVHHDPEVNRKTYVPYKDAYIDLPGLIALLHDVGFAVRLAVVGTKGAIDSWDGLVEMIGFAKANKVEQLTWRPVNAPEATDNADVQHACRTLAVPVENFWKIEHKLTAQATVLLDNPHGMRVYDVNGQNLALATSLSPPRSNEIRQIIFFPSGRIAYDWCHEGARIL
jgi:molybdenum cofactor biosynthesis enzyme MoaA